MKELVKRIYCKQTGNIYKIIHVHPFRTFDNEKKRGYYCVNLDSKRNYQKIFPKSWDAYFPFDSDIVIIEPLEVVDGKGRQVYSGDVILCADGKKLVVDESNVDISWVQTEIEYGKILAHYGEKF